jgi:undecaprenyl-diphosphatase
MGIMLELDRALLLWINGMHSQWADSFFSAISYRFTWIPLYIILFILLLRKEKKATWIPLLCIVGMIAISDQLASAVFKPWIARLRPCHEPELQSFIHLVGNYCGGSFGFYSSHASNTLALAVFWGLRSGKSWAIILAIYALLNGVSRIYLGVHYPSDILTGMIAGVLCAFLFRKVEYLLKKKF